MSLDLTEFESTIVLRPLILKDFDQLIELSLLCFPTLDPWSRTNVENQLAMWPQSQVGLFIDGQLVASCAHVIVHSSDYTDFSNWKEMSDNGDIRNHDPEGDTLYGIEIQVHPDWRGRRLARRLYDHRKELCREHNRVRTCAAARCIENHMYVVTAGCVGNLPFVENADVHYAQSAVLTPSDVEFARDGVAIEAEPNLETVLPHELDLEALRRHQRRGTVQNWNDRRRDLYRVRWHPGRDGEREI